MFLTWDLWGPFQVDCGSAEIKLLAKGKGKKGSGGRHSRWSRGCHFKRWEVDDCCTQQYSQPNILYCFSTIYLIVQIGLVVINESGWTRVFYSQYQKSSLVTISNCRTIYSILSYQLFQESGFACCLSALQAFRLGDTIWWSLLC